MPIYEYHCEACGQDFEYLVFGSDSPECTACNSKNIHRLMSACGYVSKGSGGETVSRSAGAASCGGCTSSNCAGCGH